MQLLLTDTTGRPSIRNIGGNNEDVGDARYNVNECIQKRADAEIQSLTDLYEKANFWQDPRIGNRKGGLERNDTARTLDTAGELQQRFTMKTIVAVPSGVAVFPICA
ncbi:hypothetical protein [Allohahella marinimesophila]|uniref:hypothetical protein n=1 Tax=Allohahella marinimesophila TaxID=1054972 RepID=UPI0031D474D3